MKNKSLKDLFLFLVGGNLYILIEILYRGHSHWTMFLLGGLCFLALGYINEFLPWETPLPLQTLIGMCIVTGLEFITGCIVNLWFGWHVWNYSEEWGNVLGQICPRFMLWWYFLSVIGIVLDDYLRYWLFHEGKPRYKL